jgi:Domain of unknown function (DUF4342)
MNDPIQTPEETKAKSTVSDTDIFAGLRNIWQRMNERHLVLRNRVGKQLMQLPVVWAIALLVLAFLFHVIPMVAIAVIVLLITKHQFILTQNVGHS